MRLYKCGESYAITHNLVIEAVLWEGNVGRGAEKRKRKREQRDSKKGKENLCAFYFNSLNSDMCSVQFSYCA